MASLMHKVKDMVSSDKDHQTSSSDSQTQSVDNQSTPLNISKSNPSLSWHASPDYQQSSTDATDSGNNFSNTTSYTAPENDSRFATAGQTGHGAVGSTPGYNSRNIAVDSSAYNSGGTTQQTTPGYRLVSITLPPSCVHLLTIISLFNKWWFQFRQSKEPPRCCPCPSKRVDRPRPDPRCSLWWNNYRSREAPQPKHWGVPTEIW